MSDDLERVATTTKALTTEALKPKPNKLLKFIAGFFITLIALYELAFLLVGAAYGTDVFAFILIYSVFMHITLLPFMLYGIGGFIMLSLSDQNYRAVTQQAPKILSPSERGLHSSVRVEVKFTNINLVDSEYIV